MARTKGQAGDKPAVKMHHFTEMGNTQRMLERYGKDMLFCPAFGWLVWDGKYWKGNAERDAQRFAELTIVSMYDEAALLLEKASRMQDEADRKHVASIAEALSSWARASERQTMIKSMLALAEKHVLVDDAEMFDAQPYLFNFENGTMDVRTGTLRPHSREDYLTQGVPFNYNPLAACPTFEAFFSDVMLERADLMHYVHKGLGLAMTGDTSEQAWFLLLGVGENGKSTLLEAVAHALGPYACGMSDKTIAVASRGSDGSGPSPDIARLKGKRLVTVSETEDGTRLATQLIKKMTGQDVETARFLQKENFDFHYTHKLFVFTNHEPIVTDNSHGFWRRIKRIPFDYRVPAEKKDKHLPEKLKSEIEGILVWLVEGAKLWHAEKLGLEPECIKQATDTYRAEQDILVQFINECCTVGPHEKVLSSVIFKSFMTWQEQEMNMRTLNKRTFKRMMEEHGYRQAPRSNQGVFYVGLSMNDGKVSTPPANREYAPTDMGALEAEIAQIAAGL